MVWDASGSVSSLYTARCTNPQTPKDALTQQTWSLDQCKTHEMGGQQLHLKGALQPGPGHPGSGPEQRRFLILLWVNISPGNQINRKKLLAPCLPHSLNGPKFYCISGNSVQVPNPGGGGNGLQVGRSARGRQTDTQRSLLHLKKGKTHMTAHTWDKTYLGREDFFKSNLTDNISGSSGFFHGQK